MTNRIALFLALIIVALIVADWIIYGSENGIFLAKKMMDLIEWIAFWR